MSVKISIGILLIEIFLQINNKEANENLLSVNQKALVEVPFCIYFKIMLILVKILQLKS